MQWNTIQEILNRILGSILGIIRTYLVHIIICIGQIYGAQVNMLILSQNYVVAHTNNSYLIRTRK